MKSNVLFGVISFEASIKLLKMFPVYTSIKSSPEGTLSFIPIYTHTHKDKIYTIVRACKEVKILKNTVSIREWASIHRQPHYILSVPSFHLIKK